MKTIKTIIKSTLVLLFLTVSALGYSQEEQKDNDKITRESLENAMNGGFVIGKVKDIELTIGGHIQTDIIHDLDNTNSTVFFKPSQISIPSEDYNQTLFNIGDSRLRISAENTDSNSKKLKALVEVDFRNNGNSPRLRHAWFEYGAFGAGQTWSNFMDSSAFPNIVINTGGPNALLLSRPIQFRYTQNFDNAALAFSIENNKPDITVPTSWEKRQVYPDLTASYKQNFNKNYVRLALLANPISYNAAINGNTLKNKFGFAGSVSGKFQLGDDDLKYQATYGSGYSSYLEDFSNQGYEAVVVNDQLKTVDLFGGWMFYDHNWNNRWSSAIGYGINSFGNNAKYTASATKQTGFGALNIQYQPFKQFKASLETVYGKRQLFDDTTLADTSGDDLRFQFTTLFVF